MIALVVDLSIRPGTRERVLAAIGEQARTSLAEEPGCLRFDVCEDLADPEHFVLYEIYADEEAFALHRTTPHFGRWSEAKSECVARLESTKAAIVD